MLNTYIKYIKSMICSIPKALGNIMITERYFLQLAILPVKLFAAITALTL